VTNNGTTVASHLAEYLSDGIEAQVYREALSMNMRRSCKFIEEGVLMHQ
jgi:hypothetical protein